MEQALRKCEIEASKALLALESSGLLVARSHHQPRPEQGRVVTDSRLVSSGDIFIAISGTKFDGHDHLETLVGKGVSLVVLQKKPDPSAQWHRSIPWVMVADTRVAWSHIAASAMGNPQVHLKLVGVTGTNGKTSTVWMIGELLRAFGIKTMTIGTLGAYIGDRHIPTQHTTPDPDVLFGLLSLAIEEGVAVVAMEVSSHSLAQGKLAPLHFECAAFTSFSRDHLDFHQNLDDYWSTKWTLFTNHLKPGALKVFSNSLLPRLPLENLDENSVVYGLEGAPSLPDSLPYSTLKLRVESSDFTGSRLKLQMAQRTTSLTVSYFAPHALENFAAATLLVSHIIGRPFPLSDLSAMRPVPGRLEPILKPGRPTVIIDYAHTPDALEKTLEVLKPLCHGELAVVFGCGGNRDKGKRPLMGAIASQLADRIIVTSDNPRNEDPLVIIAEVCGGIEAKTKLHTEPDRATAIGYAINRAGPKDLVLIAGKGHETVQIFAEKTVAFDDRLVAEAYLTTT